MKICRKPAKRFARPPTWHSNPPSENAEQLSVSCVSALFAKVMRLSYYKMCVEFSRNRRRQSSSSRYSRLSPNRKQCRQLQREKDIFNETFRILQSFLIANSHKKQIVCLNLATLFAIQSLECWRSLISLTDSNTNVVQGKRISQHETPLLTKNEHSVKERRDK